MMVIQYNCIVLTNLRITTAIPVRVATRASTSTLNTTSGQALL